MTAAGGHDPEGVVSFEAAGGRYTAVFGFRAMKAVELHYDLPFFEALQRAMPSLQPEDTDDPAKVARAGASVRITDIGRLFEFALLKHHPGIDEDAVDEIVEAIGLERCGAILGEAIAAALTKDEPGPESGAGDGAGGNAPRPRARKTG